MAVSLFGKLENECSDAENDGAGKDAKDEKGDYFLAVHVWIITESVRFLITGPSSRLMSNDIAGRPYNCVPGPFSRHFGPDKWRPIRRASVSSQVSRWRRRPSAS